MKRKEIFSFFYFSHVSAAVQAIVQAAIQAATPFSVGTGCAGAPPRLLPQLPPSAPIPHFVFCLFSQLHKKNFSRSK
ncbi:MAG: hypothetical protein IKH88_06945 [Prevotella sp.]|nr:hypothetical protein [Prevotella sp.]